MAIQDDFHDDALRTLLAELDQFGDKCFYDEDKKKIIYYRAEDALHAYLTMQMEAMNCHKWIESGKKGRDLGEKELFAWLEKFSDAFSHFWAETHQFIDEEK